MSKHSFSIQDQKKKKKREKQQQRYKWARVGDVKAKNLAFFNQKKKNLYLSSSTTFESLWHDE